MAQADSAVIDDREGDRRLLPRPDRGRRQSDRQATELIDERGGIRSQLQENPGTYFTLLAVAFIIGLLVIRYANESLAPLLHDPDKVVEVGAHLGAGRNYATYDLNVEMRGVRRESIRHLTSTPYVAVLGASHWQEGHAELAPDRFFYNAHVHRDYFEDPLAVTGMLLEAGRLPQQMIITIRDNLFTPVEDRTDYLWLPAIPDYRRMARRLGIEPHPIYTTLPTPQLRQSLSLVLLRANIERWWSAPVQPQATASRNHPTLDILLSDGSIVWSDEHFESFTPESSERKALEFALQRRNDPPKIDPAGVEHIRILLAFLQEQGVEIYLAHPPFNPVFYDAVRNSPYMEGLEAVREITRGFAEEFDLDIVGEFDPAEVGCTSDMYIDAEHSSPECLVKVIDEYIELEYQKRQAWAPSPDWSSAAGPEPIVRVIPQGRQR